MGYIGSVGSGILRNGWTTTSSKQRNKLLASLRPIIQWSFCSRVISLWRQSVCLRHHTNTLINWRLKSLTALNLGMDYNLIRVYYQIIVHAVLICGLYITCAYVLVYRQLDKMQSCQQTRILEWLTRVTRGISEDKDWCRVSYDCMSNSSLISVSICQVNFFASDDCSVSASSSFCTSPADSNLSPPSPIHWYATVLTTVRHPSWSSRCQCYSAGCVITIFSTLGPDA